MPTNVHSYLQVVHVAALGLHFLELIFPPPARYPDLFPVLNVLICTPVFGLVWLWSLKCGVEVGWALGGYSSSAGFESSSHGAGAAVNSTTTTIVEGKDEFEERLEGDEMGEGGVGSGARWVGEGARRRYVGEASAGVGG